jgi:hypothetical protein
VDSRGRQLTGIHVAADVGMPKKKTSTRRKKRPAGLRDTVKTKTATLYGKRTPRGRFKEMDEKGRSLKADRHTKAKTKTKSGYGDRGDRAA